MGPHQEETELVDLGIGSGKREVKIGTGTTAPIREELIILLRDYQDIFAWSYQDMPGVATYPSAGGQRETRGMHVPRKEYARSRHQRLFEENVGKTGKDEIYELFSERFGSCIYARGRY